MPVSTGVVACTIQAFYSMYLLSEDLGSVVFVTSIASIASIQVNIQVLHFFDFCPHANSQVVSEVRW